MTAGFPAVLCLAEELRSNLNYANIDGLLRAACQDCDTATRASLLAELPHLRDSSNKFHFARPRITPARAGDYLVIYRGADIADALSTIEAAFRVRLVRSRACWWEVRRLSDE